MIRLTLPLLLATPAVAADLPKLTDRIDGTGSAGLAAAYAACLAGQGDVDRTAAFFTAKGWERIDDDEIGQVELHAPSAPYIVTLWVDAARCEVTSASLGTTDAWQAVQALAQVGAPPPDPLDGPGCPAVRIGAAQLSVTAAPLDPTCDSPAGSAARFTFGGG